MSDLDRTLEPTAKRRQRARAEGHVAASPQVTAAAIWLAVSFAFGILGDVGLRAMQAVFVQLWQAPWTSLETEGGVGAERLREAVLLTGTLALPVAGACFVSAVVSRFAQVGYLWAPQRLLPHTRRLDPKRRSAELFSTATVLQLLRAGGTSGAAFLVLAWGLWAERESLTRLLVVPASEFPTLLLSIVSTWTIRLGVCLFAFAALDYACQRHRYEVNLRMSPEEMRAEIQAIQGNPQIAADRRLRHREVRQGR